MADRSGSEHGGPLAAPYAILLKAFVENRLRGDGFETVYIRLYKSDPTRWTPDHFSILDGIFFDLEDFDGGFSVTADAIDEEELRLRAGRALDRLVELAN